MTLGGLKIQFESGIRIKRGLYKDGKDVFNADAVGAFNILRKYLEENEKEIGFPVKGLSNPIVIKAAV